VIDVALTLEEVRGIPLAGVSAIVLDAVRASTTIVAALAGGASAVIPVATPDEARARGGSIEGGPVLIGGERGGAPPPGFHRGNSPAEYTPDRVRGRTVVFTTTNGTRALLAVDGARRIAFFDELLRQVRALPGVRAAAGSSKVGPCSPRPTAGSQCRTARCSRCERSRGRRLTTSERGGTAPAPGGSAWKRRRCTRERQSV